MTETTARTVSLIIQPDAGMVPIVKAIRRATSTIDIAIFRLNMKELETALGAAVQRGVQVRALVAHTNRGGEARLRAAEQRLLGVGVMVSRTSNDFVKYHGKYLVIDNTLQVLGFNYTKTDLNRSRSFGIQTRHRRAVNDARRLFECDLTKQTYDGPRSSPLVVSPETSRIALVRFIRGAKRQLSIYDQRLDDTEIVDCVKQRLAAGVDVRVIGKAPKLENETQVRALKPLRLHVRAMIRDGSQVFVGSQSMRRLELDRRREVGLILSNRAVARRMSEIFDRDWSDSGAGIEAPGKLVKAAELLTSRKSKTAPTSMKAKKLLKAAKVIEKAEPAELAQLAEQGIIATKVRAAVQEHRK